MPGSFCLRFGAICDKPLGGDNYPHRKIRIKAPDICHVRFPENGQKLLVGLKSVILNHAF